MTGLAIGAGVVIGVWLGWPGILIVAGAAVVLALIRHRGGFPIVVVGVAVLASGIGALRHTEIDMPPTPAWIDTADSFVGKVTSAPARRTKSQSMTIRLERVGFDGDYVASDDSLCAVMPPQPRVQLGDTIRFSGSASPVIDEPPGFRNYLAQRGCVGSVFARSVVVEETGSGLRRTMAIARDDVTARLQALAPGDAGVLMSGLVTGDDRAFSADRRDAFVITGTTHITAISGSNFATFVTLLVAAGTLGGWGRNRAWLAVIVVVVWGYAIFVGGNAPAIRAAIAATATVLAITVGRRPDVTTLVLLSGALMALIRPAYTHELAFQLSLAASLGISIATPVETEGRLGWLRAGIVGSVMAQVATLPFLLPISGSVPLLSIPANIAIGPFVNAAFPAALVASAGAYLFGWAVMVAKIIAIPARVLCQAIIGIVDGLASLGGSLSLGVVSPPVLGIVSIACFVMLLVNSDDVERWRRKVG